MKKSEEAYGRIREMIMDNSLQSGGVYSENQLTAKLGMSRTPIRDAVKMLESEGYVEIHRGVGIRVRSISIKEMYELYPLRYLLERYAMQEALGRIPPGRYDALLGQWRALRAKAQAGADIRRNELQALDKATHDLFVEFSGNETLRQLIDILELKIHRFRVMSAEITNDDLDTIDQHIQILAHMRAGDLDASARLMERHMHRPWEALFQEAGFTGGR